MGQPAAFLARLWAAFQALTARWRRAPPRHLPALGRSLSFYKAWKRFEADDRIPHLSRGSDPVHG